MYCLRSLKLTLDWYASVLVSDIQCFFILIPNRIRLFLEQHAMN